VPLRCIILDFVQQFARLVIGNDGLSTADGGRELGQTKVKNRQTLYNVDFRDSQEGYAVGGNRGVGVILRTDSGGEQRETVKTLQRPFCA